MLCSKSWDNGLKVRLVNERLQIQCLEHHIARSRADRNSHKLLFRSRTMASADCNSMYRCLQFEDLKPASQPSVRYVPNAFTLFYRCASFEAHRFRHPQSRNPVDQRCDIGSSFKPSPEDLKMSQDSAKHEVSSFQR